MKVKMNAHGDYEYQLSVDEVKVVRSFSKILQRVYAHQKKTGTCAAWLSFTVCNLLHQLEVFSKDVHVLGLIKRRKS